MFHAAAARDVKWGELTPKVDLPNSEPAWAAHNPIYNHSY